MIKLTALVIVLCCSTLNTAAQDEDGVGAWYMYFGTNRVTEDLSFHSEAQFRFWDAASDIIQVLLRTALNYHIDKSNIASFGYAFAYTDLRESKEAAREHRIFQQYIQRHLLGTVSFEHRYRLEERWVTSNSETKFKGRARYRILVNVPISTSPLFLSFYDEIFLNISSEVFDQNRLYGALAYNFHGTSSIQAGYMYNSFSTVSYHLFQVMLVWNTDLR